MARRTLAAAAATLTIALAGCGGSGGETTQTAQNQMSPVEQTQANDAERIATMAEGERNAVFIRAIRDANFNCQHVDKSASAGTINGAPAWTATCSDGQLWTIVIAKGGNAQVVKGAAVTDQTKAGDASAPAGAANGQ